MEFMAIDVETANADMASICQIGIAHFQNNELIDSWKTYIDPDDYFDEINVSIHGIDEKTVTGAPKLKDVIHEAYRYLDNNITVSHTHFDRVAISQACKKNNLRIPDCKWLDSAKVARRAWEQFAWKGYGLHNVSQAIGYEFRHHDALEDAKAAGNIVLAAIDKTNLDLEEWIKRVNQPIDPSAHIITRDGNPEGAFYGEVIVFTGALEILRREAASMAAQVGCQVDSGVTKRTTLLVVGDQDIQQLAGHEKSSKHRKAEKLIIKGQEIRILRESDFKELVKLEQ